MSVVIPRSCIENEVAIHLRKVLYFKSIPTNRYDTSGNISVLFYLLKDIENYSLFLENKELSESDIKSFVIKDNKMKMLFLPFQYGRLLLQQQGLQRYLLKTYPVISDMKFTGDLREYQKSIVDESKEYLDRQDSILISIPTGKGKSVIGAYLSCQEKLLTIVLYHRTKLGTQWQNTFAKNTNCKTWIVGDKITNETITVILCLDRRVKDLPEIYRRSIGMVIIDECHTFNTPSHVECLMSLTPKKIIGLSATMNRLDKMEIMMSSVCGEKIVERKEDRSFTVVKITTDFKSKREYENNRLKWSTLIQSLLYNPNRNTLIIDIINNPGKYLGDSKPHKIICLTSEKKHALLLNKLVADSDYLCGTKNDYKDSRCLFGTLSKLSTGFDESNACKDFKGITSDLLLIVCSIKNINTLIQSVGRVFRNSAPSIIHIIDDDSIIVSHYNGCKKWYREKNAMFREIDLRKSV